MKVREVHFYERNEAAARLASLKNAVIQAWVEQCEREIPAARAHSRRAIIDSLPKLIDRLVETFLDPSPGEPSGRTNEVSCEHGEERADLGDYSLEEVLHEYELLREVLYSALEVEGKLDFETREILENFLMRSVREAVVRFCERESEKLSAEKKRTERANRDLREFFMQAPLPMVIMEGPEHRFELANPSYDELIGRKAMGKTVLEVFPEGAAREFIPLLDEVYRTGKPFVGKEKPLDLTGEDGVARRRWVDFGYHPFRDADGGIRGVLAIVQDRTEQVGARRELEERTRALKSEQHKLEAVFRESPAAMALWCGRELIFEMVNPEYQSIFRGRQLVGRPLLEAAPELRGQKFDELLLKVLDTGEPFRGVEIPAKISDENGVLEDRYYDFVYVRVDDSEGKPYGVYDHALDVTEKVRNRKNLEESREKLLTSVRELESERDLRERFVAALTHDLRTPMTAAKMNAQFLLRREPDAEALRTGLLRILGALKRTDQMITDLLDTNRIKAGQGIQISRSRFHLPTWLRTVSGDLVVAYGDRFRLEIEDPVSEGDFDPSAVQRIVENLAGNAVKYGDRNRPIRIAASQSETNVRISVHNEGNPISPEDLANLFQPFRRTTSAVEGGQKGWGIGLTLVKGLAEAHGGVVGVTSSHDSGTTFYVDLPRVSAEGGVR